MDEGMSAMRLPVAETSFARLSECGGYFLPTPPSCSPSSTFLCLPPTTQEKEKEKEKEEEVRAVSDGEGSEVPDVISGIDSLGSGLSVRHSETEIAVVGRRRSTTNNNDVRAHHPLRHRLHSLFEFQEQSHSPHSQQEQKQEEEKKDKQEKEEVSDVMESSKKDKLNSVNLLVAVTSSKNATKDLYDRADEVMILNNRQIPIRSKLFEDLCKHFISGHNSAITIANSPQSINCTEKCFVSFIREAVRKTKHLESPFLVTIIICALPPDGTVVDLLQPPDKKSEKLRVGVNPIFGSCVANISPMSLQDCEEATKVTLEALRNAKKLGVDIANCPKTIIWSMILIKQVCKDVDDVYLSTMQITLLGNNVERLSHALTKKEEELWLLFAGIFSGLTKTVFTAILDSIDNSQVILDTGSWLSHIKTKKYNRGSVRKFIEVATKRINSTNIDKEKTSKSCTQGKKKVERMLEGAQLLLKDPLHTPVKVYLTESKKKNPNETSQSLLSTNNNIIISKSEDSPSPKSKSPPEIGRELPQFPLSILVQRGPIARESHREASGEIQSISLSRGLSNSLSHRPSLRKDLRDAHDWKSIIDMEKKLPPVENERDQPYTQVKTLHQRSNDKNLFEEQKKISELEQQRKEQKDFLKNSFSKNIIEDDDFEKLLSLESSSTIKTLPEVQSSRQTFISKSNVEHGISKGQLSKEEVSVKDSSTERRRSKRVFGNNQSNIENEIKNESLIKQELSQTQLPKQEIPEKQLSKSITSNPSTSNGVGSIKNINFGKINHSLLTSDFKPKLTKSGRNNSRIHSIVLLSEDLDDGERLWLQEKYEVDEVLKGSIDINSSSILGNLSDIYAKEYNIALLVSDYDNVMPHTQMYVWQFFKSTLLRIYNEYKERNGVCSKIFLHMDAVKEDGSIAINLLDPKQDLRNPREVFIHTSPVFGPLLSGSSGIFVDDNNLNFILDQGLKRAKQMPKSWCIITNAIHKIIYSDKKDVVMSSFFISYSCESVEVFEKAMSIGSKRDSPLQQLFRFTLDGPAATAFIISYGPATPGPALALQQSMINLERNPPQSCSLAEVTNMMENTLQIQRFLFNEAASDRAKQKDMRNTMKILVKHLEEQYKILQNPEPDSTRLLPYIQQEIETTTDNEKKIKHQWNGVDEEENLLVEFEEQKQRIINPRLQLSKIEYGEENNNNNKEEEEEEEEEELFFAVTPVVIVSNGGNSRAFLIADTADAKITVLNKTNREPITEFDAGEVIILSEQNNEYKSDVLEGLIKLFTSGYNTALMLADGSCSTSSQITFQVILKSVFTQIPKDCELFMWMAAFHMEQVVDLLDVDQLWRRLSFTLAPVSGAHIHRVPYRPTHNLEDAKLMLRRGLQAAVRLTGDPLIVVSLLLKSFTRDGDVLVSSLLVTHTRDAPRRYTPAAALRPDNPHRPLFCYILNGACRTAAVLGVGGDDEDVQPALQMLREIGCVRRAGVRQGSVRRFVQLKGSVPGNWVTPSFADALVQSAQKFMEQPRKVPIPEYL